MVLDDSRNTYQKARIQTQEARQSYNSLIARLERESNGMAIFTSGPEHVQTALMGVVKLKNQAQTLQTQLRDLIHSLEEFQQTRGAQAHAAINETNVAQLYERIRYQALQALAEEEELQ